MVSLLDLWLPVLVAAVFVFLGSAVLYMVLPIHRSDCTKLPNEDAVRAAIRETGVGPGDYSFPHCAGPSEMNDPEVKAKFEEGPVGIMTVWPSGLPSLGRSLVQWFVYSLVAGVFVAYLASRTLAPASDFLAVFRLAGTVAFLIYSGSEASRSIWWNRSWKTTLKLFGDGLLYAVLTGVAFAWLWPA